MLALNSISVYRFCCKQVFPRIPLPAGVLSVSLAFSSPIYTYNPTYLELSMPYSNTFCNRVSNSN